MSEQKQSHEVEGIVCRAPRQDCVEAQIYGRVPTQYVTFKVPKNTVVSLLNRRSLIPPRLFLELTAWPNGEIGGKALVREVTKNPMVTLTELQSSSVEMGEPSRRTTISAALHQSGLYGRVARRKPLLSKRHMAANWSLPKGT